MTLLSTVTSDPLLVRAKNSFTAIRARGIAAWDFRLAVGAISLQWLASIILDMLVPQNFSPWLLLSWLLSDIAMVTVVLVLRQLWLRRLPAGPGVAANVAVAALAGSVKSTLGGVFGNLVGALDVSNWPYRFFAGAIFGITIFLLLRLFLGAVDEYRNAKTELRRAQQLLDAQKLGAEERLNYERMLLMQLTQAVILPQLNVIRGQIEAQSKGSAKLETVLEALRGALERVRPLSRDLQDMARIYSRPKSDKQDSRPALPALPRAFVVRNGLFPLFVGAFSAPSHILMAFYLYPENPILLAIITLLIMILTPAGVKLVLPREQPVGLAFGVFALFLVVALSVGLATLSAYPLLQDPERLARYALVIAAVDMFATALFAYRSVVDYDRQQYLVDLQQVNSALEEELALFDQRIWAERKSWAYLVHNTIQPKLLIAISRLSAAGAQSPESLEFLVSELEQTRALLEQPPVENLDIEQALEDLKQSWAGVCSVSISIHPKVQRALKKNPAATMGANELCKEAVSNAFRHAGAERVELDLSMRSNKVLRVTATHAGVLGPARESGVGTSLLNEIAVSHSLTESDGTVVLEALIPVA